MNQKRTFLKIVFVSGIVIAIGLIIYFWAEFPPFAKFLTKAGSLGVSTVSLGLFLYSRIRSPAQTRQLIFNLGILFVTVAVCLAGAELATRYIYRDLTTTGYSNDYFSYRWRAQNPRQLNSWGFRERDFAATPTAGVYRIAVVGDSITYGQGVLRDVRATNLIDKRLKKLGRQFEVFNFGRSGTQTVDQVIILRDVVLKTDPDFILLQWFPNDVEGYDNESRRLKRYTLVPSSVLHSILWAHSAFYNVAYFGWQQFLRMIGVIQNHETYLIEHFGDPQSAVVQAADQALRDFIELTRSHGIPMGIVLFPRLDELNSSNYSDGFLHDRVLETCTEYSLSCIDLRTKVPPGTDPSTFKLNVFDSHPGPLGHEWMANNILAYFMDTWNAGRN